MDKIEANGRKIDNHGFNQHLDVKYRIFLKNNLRQYRSLVKYNGEQINEIQWPTLQHCDGELHGMEQRGFPYFQLVCRIFPSTPFLGYVKSKISRVSLEA